MLHFSDKIVVKEIVDMALKDQQMRFNHQNPKIKGKFDPTVDVSNAKRLNEIIDQFGWPTISKVGEEASYAAWLIAQHADHNVKFQEKCLEMMNNFKDGEIFPQNIAYLTDRIAVNKGLSQIYGTQFYKDRKGKIIPRKIKDIDNLGRRREMMGLESFEIYTKKMRGLYCYPQEYITPMIGSFYIVS